MGAVSDIRFHIQEKPQRSLNLRASPDSISKVSITESLIVIMK